MRFLPALILCFFSLLAAGQQKNAIVSGVVVDENDVAISNVSISILGKSNVIYSSDSGTFTIKVVAEKAFALVFSKKDFDLVQKNFFLSNQEQETITIKLTRSGKTLETIVVTDNRDRKENSLIKINPKSAITLPSTTGGVEALIKTLVGSNNELTSQYNVRGGNYDENLIYINDFEVYRPYLVSSGQQEGLSIINPALARNINFYTGAFQSKYGDKMSSVLDIQYKKPTKFGGSAYVSLLEQGMHLEGSSKKNDITFLVALRNKSNQNILSNQPTQGAYIPSATDLQTYLTWKLNTKWQLELLGIISISKFNFYPESVKKSAAVFSPLFTANLAVDIYFEGQEKDRYSTSMVGASAIYNASQKLKLKFMLSRFTDEEKEHYDIAGAYLFGERSFDQSSTDYGQIANPLGQGYYQNYARNDLNIEIWNASHKGSFDIGKHFIQWGTSIELTNIKDKLHQFEYRDSAGYSLPYTGTNLTLFNAQNSQTNLDVQKYSAYLQDNIHLSKGKNDISLQAGLRINYNNLNQELLVSPRLQASWKPKGKKDILYKIAAGMYSQPPFYRELRDFNGNVDLSIKAQKSVQFVAGMDYNFSSINGRPFRLTTEAYYKNMWQVVPYDIDNVKIRYLGGNNAKAYTTGLDIRLFGELVKDAESWISVGFMQSKEDLANDHYFIYKNASGEVIQPSTPDQIVADSTQQNVGWLRRPTDRRITAGLYLEDYLATNKNFKVHLNMLYGSNMSYNIPGSVRYRNGLIIEPYIRVDMGFSALLLSEKSARRSHNPFRGFDNIWLSAEVFNLIDRENVISYQLIKDYSNTTYAIPNRLTPRLLNLKLVARF